MAEIVKRQMPAPRDIPQKIPAPRAKIRMQKPQSGGEFSVQIPGGARGGWSWQKLITALNFCFLVRFITNIRRSPEKNTNQSIKEILIVATPNHCE